jgi:anti-sigma-K factor RskA
MHCQEFEALAGAYVLGALSPEEREEADAHLAQCANCQRMLRELQSAADLLPFTVPSMEPSAQVHDRLFAAIRAEAPPLAVPKAPRIPERRLRQRSWWHYWQTRTVLAAAVLFFLLSGAAMAWNISLQQRIAQLSAPGTTPVIVPIHGTALAAGASGQIIYLPQLDITILVVHDLPSLNGVQVYQGWAIENGHPRSIGLLQIQNGVATLSAPGDLRRAGIIAVSREPGPQASQAAPKGPVVAVGTPPH